MTPPDLTRRAPSLLAALALGASFSGAATAAPADAGVWRGTGTSYGPVPLIPGPAGDPSFTVTGDVLVPAGGPATCTARWIELDPSGIPVGVAFPFGKLSCTGSLAHVNGDCVVVRVGTAQLTCVGAGGVARADLVLTPSDVPMSRFEFTGTIEWVSAPI